MNRRLVTALCSALAVATALPAFALDSKLTGFLRTKGILADLQFQKDRDPDKLVDQRFRARYEGTVNEYLKFVYFGEVDFQWGDSSYNGGGTSRNGGGALGADQTNIETKQLYMDVKVPNSPVTATIGLQGVVDHNDWALVLADMAGVKLAAKQLGGMADVSLGWFKLFEGSAEGADNNGVGRSINEDDADFYALQVDLKPMGGLKPGVDLYYLRSLGAGSATNFVSPKGAREDLYYLSLHADYKLPMVNLGAWLLWGTGTQESAAAGGKDVDVSGYAAQVKADVAGKGWGATARVIYYSPDDDAADTDVESLRNPFLSGPVGEPVPFPSAGLSIFLADALTNTYTGTLRASPAAIEAAIGADGNGGYGLLGFVLNGSYSPPMVANSYVKGAVGFFQTIEDDRKAAGTKREGKTLGTEVALQVGYKMAKNFDISWKGAYALLGDFYDKTVTRDAKGRAITATDPDNQYYMQLVAQLDF